MKIRTVLLLGFLVLIGVLGVYLVTQTTPYTFQGSLIDPPAPAADFTLTGAEGHTFRLIDQRGKVVLLFFGYTNCPDFCPTTLSDFKRVHEQLGDKADQVEFVFITLDPERDTPERVTDYVRAFNPDFIGLSGTLEELEPVWKGYGVFRQVQEVESAAGYLLDHTVTVYLIDSEGDWRMTFPYGLGADAIAADVAHLLEAQ
jgi:protein SCO1/2